MIKVMSVIKKNLCHDTVLLWC